MHKIDNDLPSLKDILIHYGATLRATRGQVNLKCPFHSDTHASAAVNYDVNVFICHGCGVKGDTYSLIMHKEGGSYREAIKFATSVLTTGNTEIRQQNRTSRGLSKGSKSIGRRGKHLSSGSGRRTSSRS